MKERSQGSQCQQRNVNGALLDAAILEQLATLPREDSEFIAQLEQGKRLYEASQIQQQQKIEALRQQQSELHRKQTALIDSLAELGESDALPSVKARIEELHHQETALRSQIQELETASDCPPLSAEEFDAMRQRLAAVPLSLEPLPLAQKQTAIRSLVRSVVWDGETAQVVLFGAKAEEPLLSAELPQMGTDAQNLPSCEDCK